MKDLFTITCRDCSKLITKRYSTSFSMGIMVFQKKYRSPIYGIYGFVRFADEIVDTFHNHNKAMLFSAFREDTYKAIKEGISLNPVLHAFQEVVVKYNIEMELIDAFLESMEMDLHHNTHEPDSYKKYIYGSAEVIGLMCLKVFTEGNDKQYDKLKTTARSLGAAFQKVNFLRDIKSDFDLRSRIYFPGVDFASFTEEQKQQIENEIQHDFDHAYNGIKQLPKGCRLGVYLAYRYYMALFKKICKAAPARVLKERIRLADSKKMYYLCSSAVKDKFNLI